MQKIWINFDIEQLEINRKISTSGCNRYRTLPSSVWARQNPMWTGNNNFSILRGFGKIMIFARTKVCRLASGRVLAFLVNCAESFTPYPSILLSYRFWKSSVFHGRSRWTARNSRPRTTTRRCAWRDRWPASIPTTSTSLWICRKLMIMFSRRNPRSSAATPGTAPPSISTGQVGLVLLQFFSWTFFWKFKLFPRTLTSFQFFTSLQTNSGCCYPKNVRI